MKFIIAKKKLIRSFEDLECWRSARETRKFISTILKKIPRNEFDMIDNMKRAARSCTRNIAEGYGRFHYQENIQFCRISRGSFYELKDDLICCYDEKFISEEDQNRGLALINHTIVILNGYINYLQRQKRIDSD